MAQYEMGRRVWDFQDSVCLGSGYRSPANNDSSGESPYFGTNYSKRPRPYGYPSSKKYRGKDTVDSHIGQTNPQTKRAHHESRKLARPPEKSCRPKKSVVIAISIVLGILLVAGIILALLLTGVIITPNPEPEKFPASPPMGWRTSGEFYCDRLTQTAVQKAADALTNGYRQVGYSYVIIDDCWQMTRNDSGTLIPDTSKFPAGYQGMKSLGQYIGRHGLKLGLSTSVGTLTCLRRQGGYLLQLNDSKYFNDMGVDFIHGEDCFLYPDYPRSEAYRELTTAHRALPHPVVVSVHSSVTVSGTLDAHVVQLADHIQDDWYEMWAHIDLVTATNQTAHSRPGFWVDLGPLTIGRGGMSDSEYKVQFSLWCVLKSPLIMGNDVEKLTKPLDRYLLQNEDMIQVNQDPLGVPASLIFREVAEPPSKLTQTLGVSAGCGNGSADQIWEYVRESRWLRIKDRCLGRDIDGHVTIRNCFASDSSLIWDFDSTKGQLRPYMDDSMCLTLSTTSRVAAKMRRCDARQSIRNWQGANQWWHGFNDAFYFEAVVNTTFQLLLTIRNSNGQCLSVGLTETHEIYAGPLIDDSFVVLMINRDTESHVLRFKWSEVPGMDPSKAYFARNMYEKRELGGYSGMYSERIGPHSCSILGFRPNY